MKVFDAYDGILEENHTLRALVRTKLLNISDEAERDLYLSKVLSNIVEAMNVSDQRKLEIFELDYRYTIVKEI